MDWVWKCRSAIATRRLMLAFLAELLTCPAIHTTEAVGRGDLLEAFLLERRSERWSLCRA
jgi:hypothetical protein